MKTKLVFLAVFVLIISAIANARIKEGQSITGNSLSDMGEYNISHADKPIIYGNAVLETYDLVYENATNTIKIGVLDERKCKTFIVRNDRFEIQYTCRNGVFGVRKLEKRFREIPEKEMTMKLDKTNYYSQKIICRGKKSQDEYLGLIACYFPLLVNDEYLSNVMASVK